MIKVLCFGNKFLKEDSLALELSEELRVEGFEFVVCDSPEEVLGYEEVVVLDVAEGISRVTLVDDANKIVSSPAAMHDLDLGFFLKLSKKLGKLKRVRVVALPQKGKKEEIKKGLLEVLKSI